MRSFSEKRYHYQPWLTAAIILAYLLIMVRMIAFGTPLHTADEQKQEELEAAPLPAIHVPESLDGRWDAVLQIHGGAPFVKDDEMFRFLSFEIMGTSCKWRIQKDLEIEEVKEVTICIKAERQAWGYIIDFTDKDCDSIIFRAIARFVDANSMKLAVSLFQDRRPRNFRGECFGEVVLMLARNKG
jgi:hypothetical protein